MNIQQIADILEFDLEDAQMLVDMFQESAEESLNSLLDAIISNDFEQIKNDAHAIKGSASNLMLQKVTTIAGKIEHLATIHSKADYKSLYNELEFELSCIEEMKVLS